jgi:protein-tyrosine phosphatase
LNKKTTFWWAFATVTLVFGVIQFVPPVPVVIPALLPMEERPEHRLLRFEAISNFRDLGGYPTKDGHRVKWGKLYRSAGFWQATDSDMQTLEQLGLTALIDFRSALEKTREPNRLPPGHDFVVVEIPVLDEANESIVGEVMERIETGNFDGFNPDLMMLEANRQFANQFTPEFRQFIHTVIRANGSPIVWHCSAGKDRTGFAAAIILRILGVPLNTVLDDYLLSRLHALDARRTDLLLIRLFKGDEAAGHIRTLMGVEKAWLQAAFDEIDSKWGSFGNYVAQGLALTPADIALLQSQLLE